MNKINDLTHGPIARVIGRLAAPLIGASFIQMAYTMTDMLWLGRIGSSSVAAVGAAFFFIWMNTSLSYTSKIGTEILVAQSLGCKEYERAKNIANTGVMLASVISIAYALIVFCLSDHLLHFFHLEASIEDVGSDYLRWNIPGMIASFFINTFASIYYGSGDSKLPFRLITFGLILNMILDPLLIFGLGPFTGLSTRGAALATSLSQLFVMSLFVRRLYSIRSPLGKLHYYLPLKKRFVVPIVHLGLPVTFQNGLFSMISMTLASFAARFGHIGVAAQSLGSQIEAVSWMTASGFATSLSSFVGQNFGAREYQRIRKGYKITLGISGSIGAVAGICFICFPKIIYGAFISEPDALKAGADYLRILGYSQLLMVVEQVTAGAFNGIGKTQIPAIVSIVLNLLRIPLSLLLMNTVLALNGIWWSITISGILKGLVLVIWFYWTALRHMNDNMCNLQPQIKKIQE